MELITKRVESGRLVFYDSAADSEYWDDHWAGLDKKAAYEAAEKGSLGLLEKPFISYLPRKGRILEAGCGIGQYVIALRYRGYDVEGIDFAPETVSAIHAAYPDAPVSLGDATAIDAEAGAFTGYISLGVIEHRREGPEPFIREAARVVKESGVAIFTVPYFNIIRRAKGRLGMYEKPLETRKFYQYAFRENEICSLLEKWGFEVIERQGYDSYKCLKDEVALIGMLQRLSIMGYDVASLAQRFLSRIRFVEDNAGHMMLIVGQRKGK